MDQQNENIFPPAFRNCLFGGMIFWSQFQKMRTSFPPPKKNPTTASQSLSCAAGKSLEIFSNATMSLKNGIPGLTNWSLMAEILWVDDLLDSYQVDEFINSGALNWTELDIFLVTSFLVLNQQDKPLLTLGLFIFIFFEIQSFVLSGHVWAFLGHVYTHTWHWHIIHAFVLTSFIYPR